MIAPLVILGIIFALYIINFTLFWSVKGKVNLLDNSGEFAVKVFFIRITKGKVHFGRDEEDYNSLIIERRGDKKTGVHLNRDKEDKQSLAAHMDAPLFRNMLIRDIEVAVRLGKSDDAFLTTMSTVVIRAVYNTVISILKSRHDFTHRQKFLPYFNNDLLEADFKGIISISIADIIYSFIRYKFECRGNKCGRTVLGKRSKT